MWSMGRVLTVAALTPWLVVSVALAPEHVHESDSADHHTSVAHRHFAPHDHDRADHFHRDHDGAEISDRDVPIVWGDEVGIAEAVRSFPAFLVVVSLQIAIAPQPVRHAVVAIDEATLPHGPPRVSLSLRAPPSSSLLI